MCISQPRWIPIWKFLGLAGHIMGWRFLVLSPRVVFMGRPFPISGWEIHLTTRMRKMWSLCLPLTRGPMLLLVSYLEASAGGWLQLFICLSYLSSTHQNPTLVLFWLAYRPCDIFLYMQVFLCMLVYLHATAWKKRLKGYIATVSSFLWRAMFCHKMLSKSSPNPEVQIFMLQE